MHNFLDVIRGNYQFAEPSRGNEYAAWNDFVKRFLDDADDNVRIEVFKEAYSLLNCDEVIAFCGWINSHLTGRSQNYKVLVFHILKNDGDEMKKKIVSDWFLRRLKSIPHERRLLDLTSEEEDIIAKL